jgi:hypothetical protein
VVLDEPAIRRDTGFTRDKWLRPPFVPWDDALEQDGLADTPQSDHQDALGGTAQSQAFTSHPDDLAQLIAPRQLRRRDAGARSERITNGVHRRIISKLAKL